MKVAIVNDAGFCVGGTTTVCLEYAKLGFDVFFRDYIRNNFKINTLNSNISIYSSINDLINRLQDYDRILTVDTWHEKGIDGAVDTLVKIKEFLPSLEICHICCYRNIDWVKSFLNACKNKGFEFSHIFSLNPKSCDMPNASILDINAFSIPQKDWISVDRKKKYVFSSGRVEAIKGTLKYLNSIDKEFLSKSDDYIYLHEGLNFTVTKNNNIHCDLSCLMFFDTTQHPKKPKEWIIFNQYGEEPVQGKLNIYPKYNIDDIYSRWKYYYVGIGCILGTVSGYVSSNSLLSNSRIVADLRERNRLNNTIKNWNTSLEYADMEKITSGVPVLFSRAYSKIIGFKDERLIYDKFLDIPDKIKDLEPYYEDVRIKQYDWLKNKMNVVNSDIIKFFTQEF